MKKMILQLATMLLTCMLTLAQLAFSGQAGISDTRFNRRFIPSIKPQMTYGQLVELIGAPGAAVAGDRKTSPPTVQYRWNGGKGSVLTVRMRDGRLVDATVLAPNRHTFLIKSNGDVVESQ